MEHHFFVRWNCPLNILAFSKKNFSCIKVPYGPFLTRQGAGASAFMQRVLGFSSKPPSTFWQSKSSGVSNGDLWTPLILFGSNIVYRTGPAGIVPWTRWHKQRPGTRHRVVGPAIEQRV
ncbi:hypothetical protein Taro_030167 [Colocasia esculenta]|uniref:Uncharacterized protein n=1 Tax=Colocasia esculenta TaxID=4460 RepID=A0A843VR62_COLES|nr:hypothetical protein [Colocasia esculenta]